jgi:sialate O-acetylesterase
MKTKFLLFILILLCSVNQLFADVKVAKIFNDNMVLQRNKDVPVWGWADKGEKVTITFNGQKVATKADQTGKWSLKLKPMKEGGPLEMTVKGKNTVVYKNILIGEVWICSGQSNMEFPVSKAKNFAEEKAVANFPLIRSFTVAKKMSTTELNDLSQGEWQICSPNTVGNFTAIGYFFAHDLYKNLNVPIGIIHTSWGGTNAENWISADALAGDSVFATKVKQMHSDVIKENHSNLDELRKKWFEDIDKDDIGMINHWERPETDVTQWKEMKLPTYWENAGLKDLDGVVWFRKDIELTKEEAATGITLNLGAIDDNDQSYVNGNKVGQTIGYSALRVYKVDSKFLKQGKNSIVVRVFDTGGNGGFWGDPGNLFYESAGVRNSLTVNWLYNTGIKRSGPPVGFGPNSYPTMLYNAMIKPLIPFAFEGVTWYQGESNASRAYQYRTLLPTLIKDWRKLWNQGEFPFLIVQLANYRQANEQPGESDWAELREAQTMTAINVPNTGMGLAIDLGDAADIHPTNKQDVGYRLSLAARKIAYNQELIYSGPTYDAFKIDNGKITLSFKNTGSGLTTKDKYNYVKGFAIAGSDKKFYWAKAVIEGSTVTVYSDKVPNPVAVRYAWADNPDDANLYNKENLPTVPFRTDNWDGVTKGRK